jgi:hypothetical protein
MPSETPARHASYSDSFLSGLLLIISSALRRRCGGEQYLPSWKTLAAHQLFLLILFDLREVGPDAVVGQRMPDIGRVNSNRDGRQLGPSFNCKAFWSGLALGRRPTRHRPRDSTAMPVSLERRDFICGYLQKRIPGPPKRAEFTLIAQMSLNVAIHPASRRFRTAASVEDS